MDNYTADITYQIPRDVYYQLVHTLRAALPPPVSDDPADLVRRDNAMIGRIAAMLPGNADEASVAAQCVAADAQALDCLRLAHTLPRNPELALKCGAQAVSMMREARSARTLLLRLQAARQRREADSTTLDQANRVEYSAIGLMMQALDRDPVPPTAEPQPPPPTASCPPLPEDEAEPVTDLAAEAERYAIIYPARAALIRSLGRLPDNCDFGPQPPELVHAIVTGNTPALRGLDLALAQGELSHS